MTSFTNTFGGSPVSPAEVAYAAYSFGSNLTLYWPQFSAGQATVAARFMNLTATTTSLNVFMPDATLNSVGYDAIVFNAGMNTLNVVDFSGSAIATITPGQTYYIILNNNTTQAGGWQTVQFGVGTGSANAAALAGFGLIAAAGLLNVNLPGTIVNSSFSVTSTARATTYVWNGGSGVITLPTAASVGNGFFFALANNGSGSVTVTPTGGNTIDGGASSTFSQTQSGFIVSNGSNWVTIGKGIQNTFAVTLLNLNVAGSSDVVETSSQAQNIIQQFTGVLTGNINVIVPGTVQLYFCSNQTSGPYTLTVKTAAGTGVVVPQSTNSILYCDGVNVVDAFTANISGTFSLTSGTAGAPSLSFQSSVNTGLFSPGSGLFSATANGTEVFRFASQAVAVNYFGAVASATGAALALGAVGTDTNINLNILPKGAGTVTLGKLDGTIIGSNTAAAITGTTITASSFVGPLTGNVTGNVSGTSASVTGATQNSITSIPNLVTIGTIGTGVWNGTIIGPTYGGTGINNGSKTITLGGNLVTSGAFALTITATGATNVTFPTAGTLATVNGNIGNASATSLNISGLTASEIVATDGSKNLVSITALPSGVTATTQPSTDNSTLVATTAQVQAAILAALPIKAWVNFDGTTGTIHKAYNVTSVTRNGTGDYTINFTSNLADTNYGTSVTVGGIPASGFSGIAGILGASLGSAPTLKSTSQCRIGVSTNGGVQDYADVTVIVVD